MSCKVQEILVHADGRCDVSFDVLDKNGQPAAPGRVQFNPPGDVTAALVKHCCAYVEEILAVVEADENVLAKVAVELAAKREESRRLDEAIAAKFARLEAIA